MSDDAILDARIEKFAESFRERQRIFDALPESEKQAIREKEAKAEKDAETERVKQILQSSDCPKRQRANREIDRSGKWGLTEQKILSKIGTGFLICLTGIRGNGKTQLAVEIMRNRAQNNGHSQFCSAVAFFLRVKATFSKEASENEQDVIEFFAGTPFLVLDEVGQRSESEWENRLLYELLNRRYNAMSDTLLISNQDIESLEKSLGPSLISRMKETGGIIECDWGSFRK
jgi:DNA replication protein DnaC